jgi:hypothetical protein
MTTQKQQSRRLMYRPQINRGDLVDLAREKNDYENSTQEMTT